MTLGTAAFTSSDAGCPGVVYSLLVSGTASTTADSIFSMSGTDVEVSTSSVSKVGSYTIDLKGAIGSYGSALFTFTVNVFDSCASLTIATAPITSGQTYDVDTNTPLILGAAAFTLSSTIAYCPTITYQIIDTATNAVADPIFSVTGGNVIANSNSHLYIKTYNLRLEGTYGSSPVYAQ